MSGLRAVPEVVVVGQVARDLVLVVDDVPGPGGTTPVRRRREMLGGKGANQAVGLAQLGIPVAVLGVVGDDEAGGRLLAQARRDGLDVSAVVRRAGAATGLIVDIVDGRGRWRYLEDLPAPVLLTEADVTAATGLLRRARWVSVQLQQPPEAARAAARIAREAGRRIVLDGVPRSDPDELLACAEVVRADAREAEMLSGRRIGGAEDAVAAAREVLARGPSLVALGVEDAGDAFAWPGGHVVLPHTDTPVADTTGAGDALTAALIAALSQGAPPEDAARRAVAAAGATVGHPGGRPDLSAGALRDQLDRLDGPTR